MYIFVDFTENCLHRFQFKELPHNPNECSNTQTTTKY
jgi:hypothetical protein